MTPEKTVEEKLAELGRAIGSEDRFVENVMSRIDAEPTCKADRTTKLKNQLIIRRFIMSRFTKLAVAAIIIIAAALGINFLGKSTPSAYALEQTIQANHTVRYLHIKSFKVYEDEPKEFWVEFYDNGQVRNARVHMPEWESPDDGAKVIVWKENKAQIWLKKKNLLATIRDKTVAAEMLKFVEENDPRLAVERLREQQIQGKVKVEITEPPRKSEPIVITATYLPESLTPGRRGVLFVDQATKLVTTVELYELKDSEYQYTGRIEYYDYNQPIDARIFTLDEVPADAMRVDQTIQEVGLAQGKLSNEEIAVEVVRQFLEALIAGDYATASKLYQGVPVEFLEKQLAKQKFLRIVSIGKPTPSEINNSLKVPCEYEIEVDGVKSVVQSYPYVRPVFGQPERWTIDGGI